MCSLVYKNEHMSLSQHSNSHSHNELRSDGTMLWRSLRLPGICIQFSITMIWPATTGNSRLKRIFQEIILLRNVIRNE